MAKRPTPNPKANTEAVAENDGSVNDVAETLLAAITAVSDEADDGDDTADEIEEIEDSPQGGVEEAEDDDDPDGSEDELLDLSGSDDGDELTEDDEEEDDDEASTFLDLDDDDLVAVTVGDDVREVAFKDLVENFVTVENAQALRQEAAEERTQAHAERVQYLEVLAANEQVVAQTVSMMQNELFEPLISKPNDALKQSDPQRYLQHLEAYNAEQERIAGKKALLNDKLREMAEQRKQRLASFGANAREVLQSEIPELFKPETSQRALSDLSETAKKYGFTAEEISGAMDPRMFLVMRDLRMYNQGKGKSRIIDPETAMNGQKQKTTGGKRKVVRRLRSGNTTQRQRVTANAKEKQKRIATATKTGSIDDVAMTLLP